LSQFFFSFKNLKFEIEQGTIFILNEIYHLAFIKSIK
jgi:hypothetical protein